MKPKTNNAPADMPKYTSNPGEMRANIVGLFEKMPADTRDIIAQFWMLTLQEQLPAWQQQGNAARKANARRPGGTDANPGGPSPAT